MKKELISLRLSFIFAAFVLYTVLQLYYGSMKLRETIIQSTGNTEKVSTISSIWKNGNDLIGIVKSISSNTSGKTKHN